jgi:hypothetical protein
VVAGIVPCPPALSLWMQVLHLPACNNVPDLLQVLVKRVQKSAVIISNSILTSVNLTTADTSTQWLLYANM